eukprot:m.365951 g.365951  ORF g.365951 m.365951 type:complete len:171 (+) comp19974_c1_seq12:1911-2423(+)
MSSDASAAPIAAVPKELAAVASAPVPPPAAMAAAAAAPAATDDADERLVVFVLRDYTHGVGPQFETALPPKLSGLIAPEIFRSSIERINAELAVAEQHSVALYLKNFVSCLTGYLLDHCTTNPYDVALQRASEVADREDAKVFKPIGLKLVDPLRRGLRVIEIRDRNLDD